MRRKPVDQGLAYTITGGAQAGNIGIAQLTAAPFAGDNSNFLFSRQKGDSFWVSFKSLFSSVLGTFDRPKW